MARCMPWGMPDVLDLDSRDLHAPRLGLLVDDLLQALVEGLALGQEGVEVGPAEHGAQRRLRDLRRGGADRSTSTTDLTGSMTRKYATALTLAGTLSRVITSWGGISKVTVRRSTRTIRSTSGTSSTTPGPLAPTRRPEAEDDGALVLAQDAHRGAGCGDPERHDDD
jgi:hypothetical protein